jgi:hypothetical protein
MAALGGHDGQRSLPGSGGNLTYVNNSAWYIDTIVRAAAEAAGKTVH